MLYVHGGYNLEPDLPNEHVWPDLAIKFDKYEYNLSDKNKEIKGKNPVWRERFQEVIRNENNRK